MLFRHPAKLEPGQRQVPAEPVVVLLPGGRGIISFCVSRHEQRGVLPPRSPSARLFEPGAQQEVRVEEEVAQGAFTLTDVHHKAVAHQPVVLPRHPDTVFASSAAAN